MFMQSCYDRTIRARARARKGLLESEFPPMIEVGPAFLDGQASALAHRQVAVRPNWSLGSITTVGIGHMLA